jgi:hypothetical protein
MPEETALMERLHALIRYLYRPRLADKIVAAFAEALAEKPTESERLAILAHWLDYYQAKRYHKQMRRRRASDLERMTVCTGCGYPVSQRHHLLDIATHGENPVTVHLCANCHELHHLMYNALVRDSLYSQKLIRHILASGQIKAVTIRQIYHWLRAILLYEIDNGWVEPYKLSDLWIEEKLGLLEYLARTEAV